MRYAAYIDAQGERLVAEFPDCPGCQASGGTPDEVTTAARAALHRWLTSCLAEGTTPPRPSIAVVSRDWFEWIEVEPSLARRLLLHWVNTKRISRGELARRAGLSEKAIATLQNERVRPSRDLLDGVARALGVVGASARIAAPPVETADKRTRPKEARPARPRAARTREKR
jgi:predicted RNase H-like HicB family nuclease/DNA-binding XRE family transcriptional regulator